MSFSVYRICGKNLALERLGIKTARMAGQVWNEAMHAAIPAAVVGGGTYLATENPSAAKVTGLGAGLLGYLAKRRVNIPLEREVAAVLPKWERMGATHNERISRLTDAQKAIDSFTAATPEAVKNQHLNELLEAAKARGAWREHEPELMRIDKIVQSNRKALNRFG